MEKENRIFDDYIDEELKNNEEEDSSMIFVYFLRL